jgi:AcrR family transcriptional regulator
MVVFIDMKSEAAVPRREYRQHARAASAEHTRVAILTAAKQLAGEKLLAAITLNDVAEHSGVAVQTVLRRFGSREGLLSEAVQHFVAEVIEERSVSMGDVGRAVSAVVDQYEESGDAMLLLLGQERIDPQAAKVTSLGRQLHDRWVRDSFKPADEDQHRLLVIATDLYSWKLLRRDRQLSQKATKEHLRTLCTMITAG